MVSLAKQLQELSAEQADDNLAACLANLAASLTAFHTVQLPELQHRLPQPAATIFAASLQVAHCAESGYYGSDE